MVFTPHMLNKSKLQEMNFVLNQAESQLEFLP